MTPMYLYWIMRLDTVLTFIQFFNILSGILCAGAAISWIISCYVKKQNERFNSDTHIDSDWSEADAFQKCIKLPWIATIAMFFMTMLGIIFIPSTKEMVAIEIVPKICSNQQVRDISKDILDIAESWLKEIKGANPQSHSH